MMAPAVELQIPLRDGKICVARLRGDYDRPVVLFLPGLSADIYDSLAVDFSRRLADEGCATLACNLYDSHRQARKLIDCTLQTHADDLDDIVGFVRGQGARQVFVAGHSFGGLAALLSENQAFDGALLLDPSHPMTSSFDQAEFVSALNTYVRHGGVDVLIGKAMIDHYNGLNMPAVTSGFNRPALIVSAGSSVLAKATNWYAHELTAHGLAIQLTRIEGSDHSFTSDNHRRQLLDACSDWLKRQPDDPTRPDR